MVTHILAPVYATDLLRKEHPLHPLASAFAGAKPLTKRQGRKFLGKFPRFRTVAIAIVNGKVVAYTGGN